MPKMRRRSLPTKNNNLPTNRFPSNAGEFNKWFTGFYKTYSVNVKRYGFSPTQVKSFRSVYSSWNRAYKAWYKAFNAYNRYTTKVNEMRAQVENVVNVNWNRISGSTVNSGQFVKFGIGANPKFKAVSSSTRSGSHTRTGATSSKNGTVKTKYPSGTTSSSRSTVKGAWMPTAVKSTTKPKTATRKTKRVRPTLKVA